MTCAILGDSIGVGLHAWAMPSCHVAARVGIGSPAYASTYVHKVGVDLAIISLGANDGTPHPTALRTARRRVSAKRVVWLIPNIPRAAERHAIEAVAREFRDEILDVRRFVTGATLHPNSAQDRSIARAITHPAKGTTSAKVARARHRTR